MMVTEKQVERVYEFIWECLMHNEALPSRRIIATALELETARVTMCVQLLIDAERLDSASCPTAYRHWWKANVRVETRWALPRIIPLRRKLPKQMPMWETT